MGAENSVLEDCDIGKALPVVSDVDWILREAVRKSNTTTPSSSLAVFTLKKKDRRRECDIIQLNAKVCSLLITELFYLFKFKKIPQPRDRF